MQIFSSFVPEESNRLPNNCACSIAVLFVCSLAGNTGMAKRKLLWELQPADIDSCKEEVTVHGMITEMSPLKVSKGQKDILFYWKADRWKANYANGVFWPKTMIQAGGVQGKEDGVVIDNSNVKEAFSRPQKF